MKFLNIKKHPIFAVIAVVFIIVALNFVFSGDEEETYETMVVTRGDIIQSVEVTGKVQPTEERILAFERGGTVSSVLVSVGERVVRGQKLVSLSSAELRAQLKQAEASVVQAQNTLSELQRGSRPEELTLSRTAVENAQSVFEDAETSYEIILEKADTDLLSAYNGAVTAAKSGAVSAKNALISLSEIQYTCFIQPGVNDDDLSSKKAIAVEALFDVSNAGSWTAENVSDLLSGVYGDMQTIAMISNPNIIYEKLEEVLNSLNTTSDALGSMPVLTTFSATEKADLSAQKTAISSAIVSLSAKLQLIDVQKIANTSTIAAAKAAVNTAKNNLLQAQNELTLKEAGSTNEAISVGESQINAAIAQKELIEAQILTTILTSPINGIVTKQEAKQGVFVQAGISVVSVISENSYEIEVFIPEVDIVKVLVGDEVNIILDAYSDEDIFKAVVSAIDPAETVIEGVSTYKVVLNFINKEDKRIRSGMTADAEIMTDKKENVIVVPTRAIQSNGHKYIQVVNGDGLEDREVVVGLKGSSGFSEIIEGLLEGETIVTFVRR